MRDVYEECLVLDTENFELRLIEKEDAKDLLSVYSDKNAVPFFNNDNCHGDNFYYASEKRMKEAVDFWVFSYENKYFVRYTILDKKSKKAIGSIEMFHRDAEDAFDNCGLLRIDVGSHYEKENVLKELIGNVVAPFYELFYCDKIITKAPIYAVERVDALEKIGFVKSEDVLVGQSDGRSYYDYWVIQK